MDDRHFATTGTITVAGLTLLLSVVLMLLPVQLFGGIIPIPIFPLLVIFLYGLDRPSSLPPWLSFVCGLLLDMLFGFAMGPWASVFLLVHASVLWQRSYFSGRDKVVLTTGFGATVLLAMLVYWLEMSVLGERVMPLWPLLWQVVVTVAVYPVALEAFRWTAGRQRSSLMG